MKKFFLLAALSLTAVPGFAAGPAAPVTGLLNGLPVVGPVLGNVTGALPALPALGALPGINGSVGLVLQGKGVIVGIHTAAMPPVSVTTVGLPNLPPLPGLPN